MDDTIKPTEDISPKKHQRQRLIAAMLHEPGLEKAAAFIGISTTTAWRIRKTAAFQTEYMQARRDAFLQSLARLQSACPSAVTTLLKLMVGVNSSDLTRLRAAESVLRHAKDGIELEDFATRLERCEKLNEKKIN
jgi:hypothetical protein